MLRNPNARLIYFLALLLGSAATVLHVPIGIAGLFVLVPLLIVLFGYHMRLFCAHGVKKRIRSGFLFGWCFGFGYLVPSLFWLVSAYTIDLDADAWKMPLLAIGFPAYLALYYAAGFSVAAALWSETSARVFAIALAVFLGEWLRSWVLTGYPLLAIGEVILHTRWSSVISIIGITGVNGIAVLLGAIPLLIVDVWKRTAFASIALCGICLSVVVLALWPLSVSTKADGLFVRVVQSNMTFINKWRPEQRERNLDRFVELTNLPPKAHKAPDYVIWPETALMFFPELEPEILRGIARRINGSPVIISGGLRLENVGGSIRYFNTVYLGQNGPWTSIYDKKHLIPSEEYLPWRSLFETLGVDKWILSRSDYELQSGIKANVVHIPGAPDALIAICYEVLFGHELIDAIERSFNLSGDMPGWLLVLSDNAVFAESAGSAKLLAQSRIRALETGMPVVQSANYGTSAIIGPDGKVQQQIGIGESGIIDAVVFPVKRLAFYSSHRLSMWWMVCLFLGLGAISPILWTIRQNFRGKTFN